MDVRLRHSLPEDAVALAELYRASRAFLAPYDPVRANDWYTEAGQRRALESAQQGRASGTQFRFSIIVDGEHGGVLNLSNVVRGAFHSASLGYFVAEPLNGRGVGTRAVGLAVDIAFDELDLHRLEAGTLVDNVGSQKVLERNGFTRIGVAQRYLHIAGSWRDHVLFQRLADERPSWRPRS